MLNDWAFILGENHQNKPSKLLFCWQPLVYKSFSSQDMKMIVARPVAWLIMCDTPSRISHDFDFIPNIHAALLISVLQCICFANEEELTAYLKANWLIGTFPFPGLPFRPSRSSRSVSESRECPSLNKMQQWLQQCVSGDQSNWGVCYTSALIS